MYCIYTVAVCIHIYGTLDIYIAHETTLVHGMYIHKDTISTHLSWNEVLACDSLLLAVEDGILLGDVAVWLQLELSGQGMDSRQTGIHCRRQRQVSS